MLEFTHMFPILPLLNCLFVLAESNYGGEVYHIATAKVVQFSSNNVA